MATNGEAQFDNDGKSVRVNLSYTVAKNRVAVVEGWSGISGGSGDSGEAIALIVDGRGYQFQVPSGLTVNKGDVVYVTVATLTGHYPQDAAFTTSAGAGKTKLFKAIENKDANNVVMGILCVSGGVEVQS